MSTDRAIPALDAPRPAAAWTAIGFLAVFYLVSYVDRLILSLLVEPIKADLGVTDTQIGLLVGTSFAIFYVLFGLPLARLADRTNRRNLIFAGAFIWNVMTAASAFAHDFSHLLVLRIGVALGEAVLMPAAMSLIGDMFERERRSLPTSVFVGAGAVGAAGALIVGAAGLQLVSQPGVAELPLIGGMAAWRLTLLFLGVPGAVIAMAFFLLVREPRRLVVGEAAKAPVAAVAAHMGRNIRAYLGLYAVSGLNAMISLGVLSWYPTFLVRTYGMKAQDAGYLFGLIGVGASLVGGLVVPGIADRVNRRGRHDGYVWAGLVAILLIAPLLIGALNAPSAAVSLPLAGLAFMLILGLGILGTATVPLLPPAAMRGQVSAVYLLVANLVGLGLGPVVVAVLSDKLFPGPEGIGHSLTALVAGAAPLIVLLLVWSRPGFTRSLKTAAEDEDAAAALAIPTA